MLLKSLKYLFSGLLVLTLGVAIGVLLSQQGIIGSVDLPVGPSVAAVAQAGQSAPATDSLETGHHPGALDRQYVRRVLIGLPPAKRDKLLASDKRFRRFVARLARTRSVEAAAYDNGVQTDDSVSFRMRRAARKVLIQSYLNALIRQRVPSGFPSDKQITTFYRNNKQRFHTGDRVRIWQIFLQLPAGAGKAKAESVEKHAQSLLVRIRRHKQNFATVASQYSGYVASRRNDGYMGLVPIRRLKPKIAGTIQNMQRGDVELVVADNGWRILKRGRMVPGRQLSLEDEHGRIKRLLRQRAAKQIRQAVFSQAAKKYSYIPKRKDIDRWRRTITGLVARPSTG